MEPCCVRCIAHDDFHQSRTFQFVGVDGPAFAVTRHALFQDVPCLALAFVHIVEYSGEWPRDLLAHRIGQIPVANVDSHGGATDGQGAVFEVHVAAPSERDAPCTRTIVTSKDFVLRRGRDLAGPEAALVHARSEKEAAAMGDTGLQIACLLPGQKLHLLATAWRGVGREHQRWNCVHVAQLEFAPRKVLRVSPVGSVSAHHALVAALRAVRERLLTALASLS
jgi:hypothetical protein